MLLIAVCDDNKADRTQICKTIESHLQNQHISSKILAYDSAEKLISVVENKSPGFDIIFLDIVMGDMNGMTCARLIRQQDNRVRIVFLTSSTEYVYEGYEVNAAGYLVKPINEPKIIAFLEKTIAQLEDAAKESIMITSGGVTKRIPMQNILYLESQKNKVEIVLAPAGERVAIYTTLDGFEQCYLSKMWIRPHKSFLVNFQHIEQYTGDKFVLSDSTVIPVSRTYKNKAKESFFAWLNSI
ncbi:MAG: LytTR family DNA-binding domain-containing protein [Veillonellales bacterium]